MTTPYALPPPIVTIVHGFTPEQMQQAFKDGAASRDADWEDAINQRDAAEARVQYLQTEVEALRADAALSKPKCKECAKWAQEQADNKEWIETVAKGKELCKVLASAAIAAEATK